MAEKDIPAAIERGHFDALLVLPDDLASRYVHEKSVTRNIAEAERAISLFNA
ncbi:hypothetical protein [Parasphingorhabdus sp.]|jgi:hypothetical protein|uniref:hypothetical protein n=1 Tax=Parasphingorhabdus sp. TaxID=2709688 RepID=UPI003099EA51|nr:hypothetical protein [Sphingomonadales bacterium]